MALLALSQDTLNRHTGTHTHTHTHALTHTHSHTHVHTTTPQHTHTTTHTHTHTHYCIHVAYCCSFVHIAEDHRGECCHSDRAQEPMWFSSCSLHLPPPLVASPFTTCSHVIAA